MNRLSSGAALAVSLAAAALAHGQVLSATPTVSETESGAPSEAPEAASEIVRFWADAGPGLWFAKDDTFDQLFRDRFLDLHEAAANGRLDTWATTAEGALALVLLLDQFPRNAFRDTPRMYATDGTARALAANAIAAGHDRVVATDLQVFFYLPFGHSEDIADQEHAVELCARLGEPNLSRARHHRDIVRRFGRFPHRNVILDRPMRPEEQAYLDNGGYRG
jgi:uncharacterized protein (DUF924 family)